MMRRWFLLIALLLLATPALANDTTYYVERATGSDSRTSTQAQSQSTPWLSISHCVAVATSPGDRCRVKNGTYPEYVQMGASGTSGHPITIENYPGHSPKIQPTSHNLQGIQLLASGAYPGTNGIQYVTIDGLEITGAGYDGIKINSGSHIVIRNMNIHDNGGWDPTAAINGNGILSVGCYQCTIEKSRVYHNGCMACPKGHGLYLYGSGWIVINNQIYDNARYGIQTSSHAFDSANMASAVSGLAGWANGLIANNTIAYNRDRAGIVIWNAGSGVSLMSGIVVENNILYENGATSSNGSTAQGIDFLSVSGLTLTANNNIGYGSGTGSTVFTSGSSGVTITSLSTNCPATVGGNCGTLPAMANAPATVPTSPDFHLSTGSSAIGFGLNLTSTFTTDFSGTTRSATGPWSAGAYAPTGSSGGGGGSGGGTNTTTAVWNDPFNRAAEDPLTATNWVRNSASGHQLVIPSNMASIAQPKLFSSGDAVMVWTSNTLNPDQYCKVTMAGVSATNTDTTVGIGPSVRMVNGTKTGYAAIGGAFGWDLRWDLAGTPVHLTGGTSPTFALGDSLELRVHGNPPILEMIKNSGTPFSTFTHTNASALQSGLGGIFYSSTDTGQTPGSSTHGVDYVECGNYAFGVDSTPPSAPTVALSANLPNQLLISLSGSTDNVGVVSYEVQACTPSPCTPTATIAPTAGTSFTYTGLVDNTGYSVRARATDAAANLSAWSTVVSQTTLAVASPTLSNTNPSGTAVSDTTPITISVTTSIPSTCKYNTRTQGTAAYASLQQTMVVSGLVASASVTPDQHGSNGGVNHFYIACDNAANPGHTSSTVDMTFTMITPVDATAPSTISDLSLLALDTVRLQATWGAATDGVGVTGYLLSGCAGVGCTSYNITLNAAPGTTSAILALDASTTYNFIIQAYDAAGNNALASNVASSSTFVSAPPEDMTGLAVTLPIRQRSVVLNWVAPLVEASTALIEQCTPKTSNTTCSGTWAQVKSIPFGTIPQITGLTPNTSYCFRGKFGNNQNGISAAASNVACITTLATGLNQGRQPILIPRQNAGPR